MQGGRLQRCVLTKGGIRHDRGWAVRDEATQIIRGAKHIPALMQCSATYIPETNAGTVPHVSITLPDGTRTRSDASDVHERLSGALGRRVTLWPLLPAEDLDHYRLKDNDPAALYAEWRRLFALEPGEPFPDLSAFGPALLGELAHYAAPIGTYFDVYPIHILTMHSLRRLRSMLPDSQIEVRRFRPNILLDADVESAESPEDSWMGQRLQLGRVSLEVRAKAPRCVMTSLAQPGIAQDARIIRAIVKQMASCFGVYANVVEPGLLENATRVGIARSRDDVNSGPRGEMPSAAAS